MGQINNGVSGGPFLPLAGGTMTGQYKNTWPATQAQLLLGDGLPFTAGGPLAGQMFISFPGYATMAGTSYGAQGFATTAFHLGKCDGTAAAPTILPANQIIGDIDYSAYDGTLNFKISCAVRARVSEVWTSTAHGSDMMFYVTKNGTTGPFLFFTFANSGSISVPAGVAISAAGNPVARNYTLALAPATGNTTGEMIYVTNPTAGGSRPYFWSGTQWKDAAGTVLA